MRTSGPSQVFLTKALGMVIFYSNLLQMNLYTVRQICPLALFSSPKVLGLHYIFLPSLFTKKLFSGKGLVSAFLLESVTSLAARIPSPLQNNSSVQVSMGTAERQAGALLTYEGMRGRKRVRKDSAL